MNCIELSIKDLEEQCYKWAEELKGECRPDLVVYVAKAGYLIGREMSRSFGCNMVGIVTKRRGGRVKSKLGSFMKYFPHFVRNVAIFMEFKSGIHAKNSERQVYWLDNPDPFVGKVKTILIVDDSIDTGYSLKAVAEAVREKFGQNTKIKIAGLNVWDKSRKIIRSDYSLYQNTIILAPMSKDSRYYDEFVQMYKNR